MLKRTYWSKADAFILPLTGLSKDTRFEPKSFLYWKDYSIENYQLILSYNYEEYNDMIKHCRTVVFPVLDKKGYIIENYEAEGRSIFILDLSEWAPDIEQFIKAKYSLMSLNAKSTIEKYHYVNIKQVPVHILGVLYPFREMPILGDRTPIQYLSDEMGWDLKQMTEIGEVGSIYDKLTETLLTDVDELI